MNASTDPQTAHQVTDALMRLTTVLGPIQRPAMSKQGISGTFAVAHDGPARELFERMGASVSFAGVVPQLISGGSAVPLVTGMLDKVAFTARCKPEGEGRYQIDVQLSAQDSAATENVAGLYLLCDEILGGDRAKAELIAGYLNHRLSRMKGKPRARLMADVAAIIADHLNEQA